MKKKKTNSLSGGRMLAYSGYSSGCLPSRLGFFCITMFVSNGREGYGGGGSGSRGRKKRGILSRIDSYFVIQGKVVFVSCAGW